MRRIKPGLAVRFGLSAFLAVLARTGFAQDAEILPPPLPLAEAPGYRNVVGYIRTESPEVQAQRASQQALEARIEQARSGMRPKLTLSGSVGRHNTDEPRADEFIRNPTSLGLNFTQTLFDGRKTQNKVLEAEAGAASGRSRVRERAVEISLETLTALANLKRDRDILAARRQGVAALEVVLRGTQARAAAGDLAKTDVTLARVRLEQAKADQAQASMQLAASEAQALRRLGRIPGRIGDLDVPAAALPRSVEAALHLASRNNASLESAVHNLNAARYGTLAAKADSSPLITLESVIKRDTKPMVDYAFRDTAQVNLKFSVPIMDGGLVRAQVAEARAKENQLTYDVLATRAEVTSAIVRSFQQWTLATPRLAASRQRAKEAARAVRSVIEQAKGGERSIFEVLDSQRELAEARAGIATAEGERRVAAFTLLAKVGGLDPDILSTAFGAARAEPHYVAPSDFVAALPGKARVRDRAKTVKIPLPPMRPVSLATIAYATSLAPVRTASDSEPAHALQGE